MRPAGMLVLEEIAIWLGPPYWPNTTRCMKARRLLASEGIAPAIPGVGARPSLWRFSDLEPIKHLAPGALVSDGFDTAEAA